MFLMPEHLLSLHQKESKRSSNIKAEDNYFYFLERTFLRPLFSKSPVILSLAKELKSCDTKNKLTRKFKSIFKNYAELFGLQSIKLKFCQHKSLSSTRSYYHCHKRTIFINKSYFDNFGKKSVKDYSEVLYTLVHEFSHASVDIQFNSDGIHRHDYFFLYVLLDFLTQTSCIKKETFLNNHVQFNKKLLNLDSYSKQDYLIVRAKRKELFHFKTLNSIEDVEQFLLTFEVSKLPNKEKINVYLSQLNNFDRSIKIHYSNDELAIFSDFNVFIFFKNNSFEIHIEKEKQHNIRVHKQYINILQSKYNRINKIKI